MTKEQALQLIDTVCADYRGTRRDHQALIEAITLIKKLLEEKEEKKEEKNDKTSTSA